VRHGDLVDLPKLRAAIFSHTRATVDEDGHYSFAVAL
jgi:hypothetical protein